MRKLTIIILILILIVWYDKAYGGIGLNKYLGLDDTKFDEDDNSRPPTPNYPTNEQGQYVDENGNPQIEVTGDDGHTVRGWEIPENIQDFKSPSMLISFKEIPSAGILKYHAFNVKVLNDNEVVYTNPQRETFAIPYDIIRQSALWHKRVEQMQSN